MIEQIKQRLFAIRVALAQHGRHGGTSASEAAKVTTLPSRRLMLLSFAVAAFLLVPAGQAMATGTLTVDIDGTGTGTVSSVGASFAGTPPINCSGPPPTGTCQNAMPEIFGFDGVELTATADANSDLVGWTVEEGQVIAFCGTGEAECFVGNFAGTNGNAKVTAEFACKAGQVCQSTPPTVTTTAGATEIAQTAAKVAGTVNPNGDNVTACKIKYGLTTSYGSEADCSSLPGSGNSPVAVSASLAGLAANTTYHFKVVATSGSGTGEGSDQTFKTLPNVPAVTTTAGATEIAQTTAKVAGTVNPNGSGVTSCKIEYGTSTGYGSEKPCSSLPGSGSSPVGVSAALSGLTANTPYHFRVVATNGGGTANGSDQTFTTAADTCATNPTLCPPPPPPPPPPTPAPTPTPTPDNSAALGQCMKQANKAYQKAVKAAKKKKGKAKAKAIKAAKKKKAKAAAACKKRFS